MSIICSGVISPVIISENIKVGAIFLYDYVVSNVLFEYIFLDFSILKYITRYSLC